MLTPHEIAERLGVSYATVIRIINRGDLPAVRIGYQFRVAEQDLAAFMAANRVVAGNTS